MAERTNHVSGNTDADSFALCAQSVSTRVAEAARKRAIDAVEDRVISAYVEVVNGYGANITPKDARVILAMLDESIVALIKRL